MPILFIIPTQSCPASCRYCFGQRTRSADMEQETLQSALSLFKKLNDGKPDNKCKISFHGGEPLLAGQGFYEKALPLIRNMFDDTVSLSAQSNLWLLDDDFIHLFREYSVNVGTSLDGPEAINDFQRGKGYFQKTMAGMDQLAKHGVRTGCIATFTPKSARQYRTVFDFFLQKGIPFDIHTAVRPIGSPENPDIFLSPENFGNLLIHILNLYLKNTNHIKIATLDTLIRNISNDTSGLCTFSRCLGEYLAVAPDGELYSCNRFVGNRGFSLGNCRDVRSMEDIKNSRGWKRLASWQEQIDIECADCLHKNICHGGCPYIGFAHGNGRPVKDPYCASYKKIYDYILDKGTAEVFSDANMAAVTQAKKGASNTLLREGALLQIMNGETHPFDLARSAKEIAAAAALAVTGDPDHTAEILLDLKIGRSAERAYPSVKNLHRRLTKPGLRMNNLYLHITSACNLCCTHCYAANSDGERCHLPYKKIVDAICEASGLGFRKVVITGGEPGKHPEFESLVKALDRLKTAEPIPPVVLRTNLCYTDRTVMKSMARSFDEIIVSLDGDKTLHDLRRGRGTYKRAIDNIRFMTQEIGCKNISLATVFDFAEMTPEMLKEQQLHIERLKSEFELTKIRFLPLLPLGRAEDAPAMRPEEMAIDIKTWHKRKYITKSSCGLGYVLMIDADGRAYPCHVCKSDANDLGSLHEKSLADIVNSAKFRHFKTMTTDADPQCRTCQYKYICGGICKIWKEKKCEDKYRGAEGLLTEALEILGVSKERFFDKVRHPS